MRKARTFRMGSLSLRDTLYKDDFFGPFLGGGGVKTFCQMRFLFCGTPQATREFPRARRGVWRGGGWGWAVWEGEANPAPVVVIMLSHALTLVQLHSNPNPYPNHGADPGSVTSLSVWFGLGLNTLTMTADLWLLFGMPHVSPLCQTLFIGIGWEDLNCFFFAQSGSWVDVMFVNLVNDFVFLLWFSFVDFWCFRYFYFNFMCIVCCLFFFQIICFVSIIFMTFRCSHLNAIICVFKEVLVSPIPVRPNIPPSSQ